MAPTELHEAFRIAGSLFTAFEISNLFNTKASAHQGAASTTLFTKDPADSRLLVYDLCTMIGKHFDSMGCFVEYQKGGVANESSTHSDAGEPNFTRCCQLLLGCDGSIIIDVDGIVESNQDESSSKRSRRSSKSDCTHAMASRPQPTALAVLHPGAVIHIQVVIYVSLRHNRIRVAAKLSETAIVRSDCIEPLGPTPRRLVELSPLSWLWT